MIKELYKENVHFRNAMEKCNDIYRKLINGKSLLDNIFTLSAEDLSNTIIGQPSLVALDWSLREMLPANNILPSIVLSHSIRKIYAAYIAGIIKKILAV